MTVAGSTASGGTLFRYVTSYPGRFIQLRWTVKQVAQLWQRDRATP